MQKQKQEPRMDHSLTIHFPGGTAVLTPDLFKPEYDKTGKIIAWIFKG